MKIKGILILFILVLFSCKDKTCTAIYIGYFKMDSKQLIDVDINYVGPNKHKESFDFGNAKNVASYYKLLDADAYCGSTDFKKVDYNLVTLANNGKGDVYFCAYLASDVEMTELYNTKEDVINLLAVYGQQDKNPNYDYKKKHKNLKYIDRYVLYEQLIKDGYPNIIKLKPKEKCLMKWSNLGFKRIE